MSGQYDLEVDGVYHSFGGQTLALQSLSLRVEQGQIVCVLGPSGCGKSTLLRIIAGLLRPTKGTIRIRGQDQTGVPTHKRDLGFVFQNPALFPHLNVFDNVSFPFVYGRRPYASGDWREAVARILHLTGLQSHQHFSVANLSGGQVQRVALARALVYRPRLLLLDEPLSSLDNVLKRQLLDLLYRLHEEFGTTFIYVTHDEREAVQLASHVAVIDRNHILQQFAPTIDVISKPSSRAVAEIMTGWNFLQGRVGVTNSPPAVCLDSGTAIELDTSGLPEGTPVELGIRTRFLSLVSNIPATLPPGEVGLRVHVTRAFFGFDELLYRCLLSGPSGDTGATIISGASPNVRVVVGDTAYVILRKENIHVFKSS